MLNGGKLAVFSLNTRVTQEFQFHKFYLNTIRSSHHKKEMKCKL